MNRGPGGYTRLAGAGGSTNGATCTGGYPRWINSVDRISLASLVSQSSPAANSIGEWRRRTGAESGGILTLDIIYYFLAADTAGEYFQMVRDGVEKLGIDQTDAESWIEGAKAHPASSPASVSATICAKAVATGPTSSSFLCLTVSHTVESME